MTAYRAPSGLRARLIRAAGNVLTSRQGAQRLCVLNYHRILATPDPLLDGVPDVDTFRWQMQLLANCFNVLALPDALAALDAGRLPPRAVCITFDDGYRSTHDLALPILRAYDLPATVFVTTACIGSGTMWNETIIDAVRRLPAGEVDLGDAGFGVRTLHSVADRQALLRELTARAKYLPPDERHALTERLGALGGGAADLMLTADMIRTMARQRIEIGAHTVSHPILASLDDDAARREIEQCKHDLEAIAGVRVRYFAYPNGKPGPDFDARHAAMARAAGYEAAFTTVVDAATAAHDRYQLPRSSPWDATPTLYALRLLRWLAS
jgi:peptidoglycan/xylan/chitin deacetylase (PgdA/CDA1 family)